MTIANMQNLDVFEFTRLRIYDLYFLFPHLVSEISFPRIKGSSTIKKEAEKLQEPYEILPDKKMLFSEMGDYHIQALQILLAKDIFKEVDGKLTLSSGFKGKSIKRLLEENGSDSNKFFSDLIKILNQVDLAGDSGLKKRTGLMEYRYDAI